MERRGREGGQGVDGLEMEGGLGRGGREGWEGEREGQGVPANKNLRLYTTLIQDRFCSNISVETQSHVAIDGY